jgi:uncharacterized protein (DUF1499 family)
MATTQAQPVAAGVQPAKFAEFARYGFLLAVLCALAAVFSGLGYRLGWWHFRVGFAILRWAAYIGGAAAVISLVAAIMAKRGGQQRGFVWGLLGFLIGLVVFAEPALMLRKAKTLPPIHDISTDTTNPPQFVAVLPLRANADNPAIYGGPELAAQQQKAYPQIAPLEVSLAPDKAFERALAVTRDSGWDIVATVPAEGRIEATDTTLLYGFKDDVVIRVAPADTGSRIDIRSVSRVGKSDVGVNAARIDKFLHKLAEAK